MKKNLIILILCAGLVLPAFGADLNIYSYMSFDYSRGQEDGLFPEGRIGNVEGGILTSGILVPRFEYSLEFSFRETENVSIEQAWVGYVLSNSISIRFGLIPVAFGRFNLINRPHLSTLIQSPLNAASLIPFRWREIGAQVSGRIFGIDIAAYIGNGLAEAQNLSEGQQFSDNNADKGRGFRVGLPLSDNFQLGYSWYSGNYDDENSRRLKMQALDASWITQGFQLIYERIWTNMENPESYEAGEGKGDYLIGAFMVSQIQCFISYQRVEYEDPFHGPWFTGAISADMGISLKKSRWAAGLIFSPSSNAYLKLEYDWNREEDNVLKDDLLAVQIALRF
jgi:hypothetical protein